MNRVIRITKNTDLTSLSGTSFYGTAGVPRSAVDTAALRTQAGSPFGVKGCKAPPETESRRKAKQLFLCASAAYFSVVNVFQTPGERKHVLSPV